MYRKRWTLETAFQELEASLHGEINALGYPKAALFALSIAMVSYNVLSTVKAALPRFTARRRPTPRFRATIWPTKSRAPTGG